MSSTVAGFIALCAVVCIIVIFVTDAFKGTLNVNMKTVGNGQYGTARWATNKEINSTFKVISYEPEKWRKGINLPKLQNGGLVIGYLGSAGNVKARIDTSDSHTMFICTTGGGKTTSAEYANIELACACGLSFLCTDTKGDLIKNYAEIARKYYGYNIVIIDFKHPTRSDGFNLMQLTNKYMDRFKQGKNLTNQALAERYAKITARTIVYSHGFTGGGGQNAFFYDAAEGLIAATILLLSEYGKPGQRHIVSVFKLIQELLHVSDPVIKGQKPKNDFQKLIELLPAEHKARWLAASALTTGGQSMQSVLSTAMSRLLSFIDSEMEQILCFDSAFDAEQICEGKTAVFIDFPEENPNTHFMISLYIAQFYREALEVADQHGNRLKRRLLMFLDEFGTMQKIDNAKEMFTAAKSRNILIYPMIQSFDQLYENYGQHGGEIIIDCCTNILCGSFAPLSKGPETISKALGNRTVQAGSFSNGGGFGRTSNSQNYQMIQRPLMTPEEIRSRPREQWIMTKTNQHPHLTSLPRYDKWGINLNLPFIATENSARPVQYASKDTLMCTIAAKYLRQSPLKASSEDKPTYAYDDEDAPPEGNSERIPFNEDYL